MDNAVWVLQIVLAVMVLPGALANLFMSEEKLRASEFYTAGMTYRGGKVMSFWLLCGGLGLILPWALNILPVLTPFTAAVLTLVLLSAAYMHAFIDGRFDKGTATLILAGLYFFVAYTRFMEWMAMLG